MCRLGGPEKIIAPKHFEDSRKQSAINGGFGDLGLGLGYFEICFKLNIMYYYIRKPKVFKRDVLLKAISKLQ